MSTPTTQRANPGKGLLSAEDWAHVATVLQWTPRERDVASLIFEGDTCNAIARQLNITGSTVRKHLERIYEKMGARDRVDLVLGIVRVRDKAAALTAFGQAKAAPRPPERMFVS